MKETTLPEKQTARAALQAQRAEACAGLIQPTAVWAASRRGAPQAAAGLLFFGLLGGLGFGRLIAPRSGRRIVATALLTVALLGLLGVGTLASSDRRAFRRLRFTGIVSEAPKAIELV